MHRLILCCALWLASLATAGAATREYVMLFQDRDSGGLTVTEAADGSLSTRNSYRDNGRGPDLDETMRYAGDGRLLEYSGSGRSTFGAPILERFERHADGARWQLGEQQGEFAGSGGSGYLPVEASPELWARLAQQAAGAEAASLPLIPAGSVRREDLGTLQDPHTGITATLVALHGLSLRPSYLWLDGNGQLLAEIEPGYSQLVRKDALPLRAQLEARQSAAQAAALQQLRGLGQPLPGLTVLRNVRVFDSRAARLGAASDVFIERGRFTAIYPAGAPIQGPVYAIEGGGRVLLPGLFDMHVHIAPGDGPMHLAVGVTSVRDLGGENADVLATMDAFATGSLPGPRLIPAGYIEGESPFASRGGFVIEDLPQAQAAIDWYAQRGYPQIKLYNSFPRSILPATVAYAHQRGLWVSGHVPAFLRAEEAVRAGYDELQHINQLFLNFLVKPGDDTRTLLRFDLVAAEGGQLDLDGSEVQAFIQLLTERQVVVDPTLATFENFRQRPGSLHPSFAMVADRLPALLARSLTVNSMDLGGAKYAPSERAYRAMIDLVGRMHRAGVRLLAGSDDLPGFTYLRELELYVEAGIPAAEVLRIASWNGAQIARVSDRLGSIEVGKLADAVLIEGDPTRDISDVRRAVLVIKDARAYRPDQLFAAVGVRPGLASLPLPAADSP